MATIKINKRRKQFSSLSRNGYVVTWNWHRFWPQSSQTDRWQSSGYVWQITYIISTIMITTKFLWKFFVTVRYLENSIEMFMFRNYSLLKASELVSSETTVRWVRNSSNHWVLAPGTWGWTLWYCCSKTLSRFCIVFLLGKIVEAVRATWRKIL
jgi:hypothetical protein